MYLSLIDAVSKIVKTYGVDILSDTKFWHILSDSFPFGNEYALKDTFKRCLNLGYVSKLVAIKGNTKRTKIEIVNIVDSENKLNPGREKEYSGVLYSVAIAIGSCLKEDYIDQSQDSLRKKRNKTNGQSVKCQIFSWSKYSISNILSLTWGICAVFLSAALYGLTLYCGFPLWLLVVIIGVIQLSFISYNLRLCSNKNNDISKSLSLPIITTFFLIDCIPIGLTISRDFHTLLWSFFSGYTYLIGLDDLTYSSFWIWGSFNEIGGLFSVLLSLLLMFCVVACFTGIISKHFSPKRITLRADWISILISTILILLLCSICYSVYYYKNNQIKEHYIQSKDDIHKRNTGLNNSRKEKTVDLSFKGIRLGIDYSTCIGYADSIFRDSVNNTVTYEIANIKEYDDSSIAHFSRVIKGTTQWDNQLVKVSIYDYEGTVGEIIIEPDKASYSDGFQIYSRVIRLYTDKYGEPEKDIWSPMLHYFKEKGLIDKPFDWTYYYWNFKNGSIKIDYNSIVYQSEDVIKCIKDIL